MGIIDVCRDILMRSCRYLLEQWRGRGEVQMFIVRAVDGKPLHMTTLLSLYGNNKSQSRSFSLELPGGDDSSVRIVASTNGLLLCVREGGPDGRRIHDDCYLYNPCTKEHVVIPRPTRCHPKGARMLRMGIAFDPAASCSESDTTASYTIVNAFEIPTGNPTVCQFGFEVYSSSSPGSWRVCEKVAQARQVYSPPRVLVSQTGALFYRSLLFWPLPSAYILTFDVATETPYWNAVPNYPLDDPREFAVHRCAGWLGEHQGRLLLATITHRVTGVDGELNIDEELQVPPYFWQWWRPDGEEGRYQEIDMREELLRNPSLANMLDLSHGLCYGSTHSFRPVGMARRGESDVVMLAAPCGRTLVFDLRRRTLELLIDVLHQPDDSSTCPLPPYSRTPTYFPYSPTTKRLSSACLQ